MHRLRLFFLPAFATIVFAVALPARGQVLPSIAPAAPANPAVRQDGLFVTAPLIIDGAGVFRLACLASPPPGAVPIDTRVLLVQNAVNQVLAMDTDRGTTQYDAKTLRVSVAKEGSQDALLVNDARHPAPIAIVTITSDDAQYNGMSSSALAQQWRSKLQTALSAALVRREPASIRKNLTYVGFGALVLLLLTVVLVLIYRYVRRRIDALNEALEKRMDAIENASAQQSGEPSEQDQGRMMRLSIRATGPEQRLRSARAMAGLLLWGIVLAWVAGFMFALMQFPQTAAFGEFLRHATGRVALIWIGAALIDRVLELAIVRIADMYAHRGGRAEDRARHVLRAPTISRALAGFKSFIVLFVASVATLSAINIPIASVVTIGGIAAVAIGFAAQSLVRDCLNGLLVLIEDQYVVGDYVMIGDYNGTVEHLSLRVVQIRDSRGYLVTIPHSSVAQVVNASRAWARVDYRVAIDPGADLQRAIAALNHAIASLGTGDAARGAPANAAEAIGVEMLGKNGIVLRASIRTAPMRQFELRRVLNERVYALFAKEGIAFGVDPLGLPTPAPTASPDPA